MDDTTIIFIGLMLALVSPAAGPSDASTLLAIGVAMAAGGLLAAIWKRKRT